MYFGQNIVTGDGSGGNMTNIFTFKGEAEPLSGRFFNLEQFSAHSSSQTAVSGRVLANNWERLSGIGLINREWRFEIENNGVDGSVNEQFYIPFPLFLGSAAPVADLSAQLEVAIANVDLTTFVTTIQGYIWEARSVQAEGGLRRPVDSLYGR